MSADSPFAGLAASIAASKRAKFAGGVSEAVICDAENHVGLRFPPSYRWWLAQYGTGYLGSYELQGLFPDPIAERDPEMVLVGDIIDLARRNAANQMWPAHLLELLSYEGDEVYFFDTSRQSADGEWPIVCLCAGEQNLVEIAPSFGQWLQREVR